MTPFSILLSSYIKNKNVRTHQLAQFCGIDRSNMYKVISGKRNPASEQLVHKIADFIKLTPVERNEFWEAYKITIIGHDTYYRRKHTQQFITNFSKPPIHTPDLFSTITSDWQNIDNQEFLSIKNKDEIYQIIYNILTSEAQNSEGFIQLVIQPSSGYFMKLLSAVCQSKPNLRIEHIICLNNAADITTNKLHYNLQCLQEILPMYRSCLCDYMPSCYYDSIISHDSIFHLFSSMVITSRHALVFSPTLQYGTLFLRESTVKNFQDVFSRLKSQTSPIVCRIDSAFTQLSYFNELDTHSSAGFSFQQQPCMIPLLPPSLLDKYIIQELPNRSDFINSIMQYTKEKSADFFDRNSQFIFTEKGVADFFYSGRIFEFPDTLYHPIEPKDRSLIIRNLITVCKTGRYKMLRPDSPIAESQLCIYANSQNGYLIFTTINKQLVYLKLEEASLLYSFYDYLENMDPGWFYSPEETVEILKSITQSKSAGK